MEVKQHIGRVRVLKKTTKAADDNMYYLFIANETLKQF
jgi:hypothetical protein